MWDFVGELAYLEKGVCNTPLQHIQSISAFVRVRPRPILHHLHQPAVAPIVKPGDFPTARPQCPAHAAQKLLQPPGIGGQDG